MKINVQDWEEFYLSKLFRIKKGKRLTSNDQENGENNYVGAIDSNNGIANHIRQKPINKGNTISLSYNGSVGEAFYQKDPYWATDDVNALYSNYDGFNEYIGLFIVTIIKKEKYKFSYGRKWTLENMNESVIKLPIQHNSNGEPIIDVTYKYSEEGYIPDWQFMENYIKSLHHKPLITKNKIEDIIPLEVSEWKEFVIGKIFSKRSITKFSSIPETDGIYEFISSTSMNNGVAKKVDGVPIDGNCITVSTNGECFDCFYHESPIVVSTDVDVLYSQFINKYTGIFICSILKKEKIKWSFGRKPKNDKVFNTIIKLPIQHNTDGTPFIDNTYTYSHDGYVPDWKYMEEYIKKLPYGDRL